MIVKISIEMIEQYLGIMLGVWIAEYDVEADNLDEYKEYIFEMEKHFKSWNDEKYFQLALADLIVSDDIPQKIWDDIEDSINYVFVEHPIKDIIEYAYSVLWQDIPPKEALNSFKVKFISSGIDLSVWRLKREELNPSFNKIN